MGPCWHPTQTKFCVCVENSDMHLTLGFVGSNTDLRLSPTVALRHKLYQKTAVESPASRSLQYFLDIAARMGVDMTPETSPRPPNTSLEATKEPLKSSARPTRAMQNGLQNTPRASKAAKNFKNLKTVLKKSMGYPSRPGFWA